MYQGLLRFPFVLHRHVNFRLLLVQFVISCLNTLVAFCGFWTLLFLLNASDRVFDFILESLKLIRKLKMVKP